MSKSELPPVVVRLEADTTPFVDALRSAGEAALDAAERIANSSRRPRDESSENPNACAMTPIERNPMNLGTSVVFGRHESNGANEHAAIVTRVWAEDDSHPTVNLKVFPDCGDSFDVTSVQYWKNAGWGSSYYYREA